MKRTLLTVLLAICLVTASAATVTAQSDDEDDDRLVTVAVSAIESPIDFGMAVASKASTITNTFRSLTGDVPTPSEEVDRLQTFLNDNEGPIVNHTNDVIDEHNYSVGNGTYTYELTINGEDTSDTLYLVGTADGENVTGYSVVNDTNNTVTDSFTISEFQAEDLNEDVREYYDEYVATSEVPDKGYYVGMAVKYTDLIGGNDG